MKKIITFIVFIINLIIFIFVRIFTTLCISGILLLVDHFFLGPFLIDSVESAEIPYKELIYFGTVFVVHVVIPGYIIILDLISVLETEKIALELVLKQFLSLWFETSAE